MLNGVEVLSQRVVDMNGFVWWQGFMIIVIIVGIIISCACADCGQFYGVLLGIATIFTGLGLFLSDFDDREYIEYKVTITDEVNFNEFNNKYEVVSQDGKIYTIKEKEVE